MYQPIPHMPFDGAALAGGEPAIVQIVAATPAGMTTSPAPAAFCFVRVVRK
jgi:hypothetical protein